MMFRNKVNFFWWRIILGCVSLLFIAVCDSYGGGGQQQYQRRHPLSSRLFPKFQGHIPPPCSVDGYFPNQQDCRSFFLCRKGRAFPRFCPTLYHFNPMVRNCLWTGRMECPQPYSQEIGKHPGPFPERNRYPPVDSTNENGNVRNTTIVYKKVTVTYSGNGTQDPETMKGVQKHVNKIIDNITSSTAPNEKYEVEVIEEGNVPEKHSAYVDSTTSDYDGNGAPTTSYPPTPSPRPITDTPPYLSTSTSEVPSSYSTERHPENKIIATTETYDNSTTTTTSGTPEYPPTTSLPSNKEENNGYGIEQRAEEKSDNEHTTTPPTESTPYSTTSEPTITPTHSVTVETTTVDSQLPDFGAARDENEGQVDSSIISTTPYVPQQSTSTEITITVEQTTPITYQSTTTVKAETTPYPSPTINIQGTEEPLITTTAQPYVTPSDTELPTALTDPPVTTEETSTTTPVGILTAYSTEITPQTTPITYQSTTTAKAETTPYPSSTITIQGDEEPLITTTAQPSDTELPPALTDPPVTTEETSTTTPVA